ncbi:MAG TPA: DUF2306 domain-containing protein [Alphaproteobacteria bacterium]|nr:DUF2306 domain-containing protein [Alphaproteobacteria bacterium]
MTARTLRRAAWGLMAALSAAIALYSLHYQFAPAEAAPPLVRANRLELPAAFLIHAGAAALALALGPLQMLPGWRRRHPARHRWIGRAYAAACLVGGAAALPLALNVGTGPVPGAGFGTLAVLWLATTSLGLWHGRRGDVGRHRAWMIRSFALTFAAVTLRLQLGLSGAAGLDLAEAYRVIAWSAWIPNLLAAEWLIRRIAAPAARLAPAGA